MTPEEVETRKAMAHVTALDAAVAAYAVEAAQDPRVRMWLAISAFNETHGAEMERLNREIMAGVMPGDFT